MGNTMQTVEIREFGGPDVLVSGERSVPEAGAGDVLIEVVAAGVNGPDLVQRRGHYPPPKGASDLLGLEVSGRIAALGDGVERWAVGDEVTALTNGGGYAGVVAVDADHVLAVPDGVSLQDAAGLPETYFTVWSNLFHGQDVGPDKRALIHGGAGGIGSTAIQLLAARGCEVFTTVGSPEDAAFVTELGATRAIDFRTEDYVAIVREAGSADIILDIIGGEYVARNVKAARPDARIVQLAFNAGSKIEIDLMPVMLKRLTYTGSTLRSRPDAFKTAIARELEAEVWPMFGTGALRPLTFQTFPMSEAAAAHAAMEAASHRGKILLLPD